jgi:hypothetical protein
MPVANASKIRSKASVAMIHVPAAVGRNSRSAALLRWAWIDHSGDGFPTSWPLDYGRPEFRRSMASAERGATLLSQARNSSIESSYRHVWLLHLSHFIDPTGQFAEIFPFHQIEISVIVENDLCFAVLENCVHSSVSGSKSVLNPCVGGDKLTIAVVETRFKSGHLNSPH